VIQRQCAAETIGSDDRLSTFPIRDRRGAALQQAREHARLRRDVFLLCWNDAAQTWRRTRVGTKE